MDVCRILAEYNCDETIQTAGVLHDTIEDTYTTLEDIKLLFGTEVARIVEGCSESSKIKNDGLNVAPWKERKEHTIYYLEMEADLPILLVATADKLDNLRSMRHDLDRIGEELWKRFNAGREEQSWYYNSFVRVLKKRAEEFGEPLSLFALIIEKEVKFIFD